MQVPIHYVLTLKCFSISRENGKVIETNMHPYINRKCNFEFALADKIMLLNIQRSKLYFVFVG